MRSSAFFSFPVLVSLVLSTILGGCESGDDDTNRSVPSQEIAITVDNQALVTVESIDGFSRLNNLALNWMNRLQIIWYQPYSAASVMSAVRSTASQKSITALAVDGETITTSETYVCWQDNSPGQGSVTISVEQKVADQLSVGDRFIWRFNQCYDGETLNGTVVLTFTSIVWNCTYQCIEYSLEFQDLQVRDAEGVSTIDGDMKILPMQQGITGNALYVEDSLGNRRFYRSYDMRLPDPYYVNSSVSYAGHMTLDSTTLGGRVQLTRSDLEEQVAYSEPDYVITAEAAGTRLRVEVIDNYNLNLDLNGYQTSTVLSQLYLETGKDDYGNSTATAGEIVVNTSVAARMDYQGDVDFFAVTLPEEGRLRIQYDSGYYSYQLYDAIGQPVYQYTYDEFILQPGVYFLSLQSRVYNSGQTVYEFSTQFTPLNEIDDHGNSLETATVMSLNSSIQGSIEYFYDQDYFRIDISANGRLSISSQSASGVQGDLYDSNGQLLQQNYYEPNYPNFEISYAVSAGSYYVRVQSRYGYSNESYTITANFTQYSADHGNSLGSAQLIDATSSTAANIDFVGDLDYFRLDIPTGGYLRLYTEGATPLEAQLLDSNGVVLAVSYTSPNINIQYAPSATTYYVKIKSGSYPESAGSYILHSQFVDYSSEDHGNDTGTATVIDPNSSTNGVFEFTNDLDYFRIDVQADGFLHLYTEGGVPMQGELLDSSGIVLATNYNYPELNIQFAAVTGTYYVRLASGYSQSAGIYTLISEFYDYSNEDHGNSIDAATLIEPTSNILAAIDYSGDSDVFRIDVPADGYIHLSTEGGLPMQGQLLNSGGSVVATSYSYPNVSITYTMVAGTYYISVSANNSQDVGVYTLVSEFTDYSNEDHGNGITTATLIEPISSTAGVIDYPGDWDYFRIDIVASGTLTVFTSSTIDTYGTLYDSSGVVLMSNDDSSLGLNFMINYAVVPGTYYLAVRHFSTSGTGLYTLQSNFVAGP